jgi:hypothetical protein
MRSLLKYSNVRGIYALYHGDPTGYNKLFEVGKDNRFSTTGRFKTGFKKSVTAFFRRRGKAHA